MQIDAAIAQAQALPGQVVAALAALGGALVTVATNAWRSFLATCQAEIANVIAFFTGVPGRSSTALAPLPGQVTGVATRAGQGFLNGVTGGFNATVAFVRGIPGAIVGALGNMGGLLIGAGRAVIDGLLAGIRAGVRASGGLRFGDRCWDRVSQRSDLLRPWFVLRPAGLALMAGLLDGIKEGHADIIDFAGTIADSIATGAAGGLIASARGIGARASWDRPGRQYRRTGCADLRHPDLDRRRGRAHRARADRPQCARHETNRQGRRGRHRGMRGNQMDNPRDGWKWYGRFAVTKYLEDDDLSPVSRWASTGRAKPPRMKCSTATTCC